MKRLAVALAAVALTWGLTAPPAAAASNVVICHAAVSDGGLRVIVYNATWSTGWLLYRGDCKSFGRSQLTVGLYNGPVSWRVRSNPGTWSETCHAADWSNPGSKDRYEYWVHDEPGCAAG